MSHYESANHENEILVSMSEDLYEASSNLYSLTCVQCGRDGASDPTPAEFNTRVWKLGLARTREELSIP